MRLLRDDEGESKMDRGKRLLGCIRKNEQLALGARKQSSPSRQKLLRVAIFSTALVRGRRNEKRRCLSQMIEPTTESTDDNSRLSRRQKNVRHNPPGDRLPPHDLPSEQGILGCILISPNECMGTVIEQTRGNHEMFFDLANREIFAEMRSMYDRLESIDLVTLGSRLKTIGLLDQVGGYAYLSQIQDGVPSAGNLPHYLKIVREKFKLRRVLQACGNASARVFEHTGDPDQLFLDIESEFSKMSEEETPQTEEHIRKVMGRVITDMEQWHYARGSQQIRGLPLGVPGAYIDKIVQGLRENHFMTLAGRPGDGKSSLAMNVVEFLAKDYVWYKPTGKKITVEGVEVDETVQCTGIPIGVFSIEMDNESLCYRLVFGRAGVDSAQFNQGFAKHGDHEKLAAAAGQLCSTNIYLDDTPAQSINQIAAKARRMVRQHGIKLFVLDYLQLCQSDNARDDERTRLDKISKKIVALKKQLKVPWLVLAQMNRNIETSERERAPVLSDLAGSGAIENDSDKVLILKKTPRKEITTRPQDANGQERLSDSEIIDQVCEDWEWSRRPRRVDAWVVKNRHGPTGKVEMLFQNNLCRFEDWHLWKVKHNIEARKEGESKHIGGMPSNEELGIKPQ